MHVDILRIFFLTVKAVTAALFKSLFFESTDMLYSARLYLASKAGALPSDLNIKNLLIV